MEKTADYQYVVFRENGLIKLRNPGGQVIPYDNRFNDCPHLNEGERWIKEAE